eukprot:SAG25_NODE_895_length_4876_cov_4.475822_2_plen_218_part_00
MAAMGQPRSTRAVLLAPRRGVAAVLRPTTVDQGVGRASGVSVSSAGLRRVAGDDGGEGQPPPPPGQGEYAVDSLWVGFVAGMLHWHASQTRARGAATGRELCRRFRTELRRCGFDSPIEAFIFFSGTGAVISQAQLQAGVRRLRLGSVLRSPPVSPPFAQRSQAKALGGARRGGAASATTPSGSGDSEDPHVVHWADEQPEEPAPPDPRCAKVAPLN